MALLNRLARIALVVFGSPNVLYISSFDLIACIYVSHYSFSVHLETYFLVLSVLFRHLGLLFMFHMHAIVTTSILFCIILFSFSAFFWFYSIKKTVFYIKKSF